MPPAHAAFLENAIPRLIADERITAIGLHGSIVAKVFDSFSDIDLIIGCEAEAFYQVFAERHNIALSLGKLLASFTPSHIKDVSLYTCLFGDPLLHVDLKFVNVGDPYCGIEKPALLWQRDHRFRSQIDQTKSWGLKPDIQWIEDRFWVWIHALAMRIARGEFFEALDFIAFLRTNAIGPLISATKGMNAYGVRRIEMIAPEAVPRLAKTVASYDRSSCICSGLELIAYYRDLRSSFADNCIIKRSQAEHASTKAFHRVARDGKQKFASKLENT
jgi:hypothetical protein